MSAKTVVIFYQHQVRFYIRQFIHHVELEAEEKVLNPCLTSCLNHQMWYKSVVLLKVNHNKWYLVRSICKGRSVWIVLGLIFMPKVLGMTMEPRQEWMKMFWRISELETDLYYVAKANPLFTMIIYLDQFYWELYYPPNVWHSVSIFKCVMWIWLRVSVS